MATKKLTAAQRQAKAIAAAKKKAKTLPKEKRQAYLKRQTAAIKKKYAPTIQRSKARSILKSKYSAQMALINSNKGLQALFERAVRQGWAPEKFQAEFQNTAWYKQHSETWRNVESVRLTDPKSYQEKLTAKINQIRAGATQLGAQLSEAQIKELSINSLYGDWDDATTQQSLVRFIKVGTGYDTLSGQAGELEDSLKKLAAENGMQYSSSWYTNAAQSVFGSKTTEDDWAEHIRNEAAGVYKVWGDKIKAGVPVKELASSYTTSLSQILEIPESEVSLADPKIRAAITATDTTGAPAVKPLIDFEKELRQDPRWLQTKNGQETAVTAGMNLAKSWGLVK